MYTVFPLPPWPPSPHPYLRRHTVSTPHPETECLISFAASPKPCPPPTFLVRRSSILPSNQLSRIRKQKTSLGFSLFFPKTFQPPPVPIKLTFQVPLGPPLLSSPDSWPHVWPSSSLAQFTSEVCCSGPSYRLSPLSPSPKSFSNTRLPGAWPKPSKCLLASG